MSALEDGEADAAVEVVAYGCEGVLLPQVAREEHCEVFVCAEGHRASGGGCCEEGGRVRGG